MADPPIVFLSHASEDGDRVIPIYERLRAEGFRPWMDRFDLVAGERWEAALWRTIRRADFVMIFLTARAVEKRGVLRKEVRRALEVWEEKREDDVFLIPVRLDHCTVPDELAGFHYVDLFEPSGIQRLLDALREGQRRRAPAAESTPGASPRVEEVAIRRSHDERPSCRIEVMYPQIAGLADTAAQREVNERLRAVAEELASFCGGHGEDIQDFPGSSEIAAAPFVSFLSASLLSARLDVMEYVATAAHPNHRTVPLNFALSPVRPLRLPDLFRRGSPWCDALRRYCISDVCRQYREDESEPDERSMKDGVEANIAEAADTAFTFTRELLVVVFDPYEVGCYGWGRREVYVPYEVLLPHLDREGPSRVFVATRRGGISPLQRSAARSSPIGGKPGAIRRQRPVDIRARTPRSLEAG